MSTDKDLWERLTGITNDLALDRTKKDEDYRKAVIEFLYDNDYDMLNQNVIIDSVTRKVSAVIQEADKEDLTDEETAVYTSLKKLYESRRFNFRKRPARRPALSELITPVNKPPKQPPKTSKTPVTNNTPSVKSTGKDVDGWPNSLMVPPKTPDDVKAMRNEIYGLLENVAKSTLKDRIPVLGEDGKIHGWFTVEQVLTDDNHDDPDAWDPSDWNPKNTKPDPSDSFPTYIRKLFAEAKVREALGVLTETKERSQFTEENLQIEGVSDLTERKKAILKFLKNRANSVLEKEINTGSKGKKNMVKISEVLDTKQHKGINLASDSGVFIAIRDAYIKYVSSQAHTQVVKSKPPAERAPWPPIGAGGFGINNFDEAPRRKNVIKAFIEANDNDMLLKDVKVVIRGQKVSVAALLKEPGGSYNDKADFLATGDIFTAIRDEYKRRKDGDPVKNSDESAEADGSSDEDSSSGEDEPSPAKNQTNGGQGRALPPNTATTTTREKWEIYQDIVYPSVDTAGPRQDAIRTFLRRNDPEMLNKGWIQYEGEKYRIAELLSGQFNDPALFSAVDGWVYLAIRKEYERRRQEFISTRRNEPYKEIDPDGSTTGETPKNNTNDQPVESDSDGDSSVDGEDEPAQESNEPGAFRKIMGGIAGGGKAIIGGLMSLATGTAVSTQVMVDSLDGKKDDTGEPLISPEVLSSMKSAQESFEELQREVVTLREANTKLKEAMAESTERERLASERHKEEIQRIKNNDNKTGGAVAELTAALENQKKENVGMQKKHDEAMAAKEKEKTEAIAAKNDIEESWHSLNRQILVANQREEALVVEKKKLEKDLNQTREELQAKKGSNGNESDEMRLLREQYHTYTTKYDKKISEYEENANRDKAKLAEVNESLETLRKEHTELAETSAKQTLLLEESEAKAARSKELLEDSHRSFKHVVEELALLEASVEQQREVNRGLETRIKEQNAQNTRLATGKIDAESREEALKQELEAKKLLITEQTRQLARMKPTDLENAIKNVSELAKLEEGMEKVVLQKKANLLQQRLDEIGVYHLDGDVPTIEKKGAMKDGVDYYAMEAADFDRIMRHWAHYRLLQIERKGKIRNFYELMEQYKSSYANPNGELYNTKGKFYYTVLSEEHKQRLLNSTKGASRVAGTGYDSFKATSRALTLTDHVQQLQLSALLLDAPGSESVTVTFNDSDGYPMLGFVATGLPVQYVEGRGALLVIDMAANWANLAYTYATHMGRTIIDSHGTMVVEHGDLKDTYFLDIQAPPVTALEYAYGQESLVTVASADDTRVSLLVSYVTVALSSLKRLMIPVHSNALPAAPRAVVEEEEEDIDTSKEKQHVSEEEEEDAITQPPPEKDEEEGERKREEEERRYEESRRAGEERERQAREREEGSTSDASSTSPKAQASFDAYQDVDTDDDAVFDAISEWK